MVKKKLPAWAPVEEEKWESIFPKRWVKLTGAFCHWGNRGCRECLSFSSIVTPFAAIITFLLRPVEKRSRRSQSTMLKKQIRAFQIIRLNCMHCKRRSPVAKFRDTASYQGHQSKHPWGYSKMGKSLPARWPLREGTEYGCSLEWAQWDPQRVCLCDWPA